MFGLLTSHHGQIVAVLMRLIIGVDRFWHAHTARFTAIHWLHDAAGIHHVPMRCRAHHHRIAYRQHHKEFLDALRLLCVRLAIPRLAHVFHQFGIDNNRRCGGSRTGK